MVNNSRFILHVIYTGGILILSVSIFIFVLSNLFTIHDDSLVKVIESSSDGYKIGLTWLIMFFALIWYTVFMIYDKSLKLYSFLKPNKQSGDSVV